MRQADVVSAAMGYWPSILYSLGVDERFLQDKHGECPFCGGKDRYRFSDHERKGRWVCNQCGHGDGFEFIQRYQNCDFKTAVEKVKHLLMQTPSESITVFTLHCFIKPVLKQLFHRLINTGSLIFILFPIMIIINLL